MIFKIDAYLENMHLPPVMRNRNRMFLGLPDPDPLVQGTETDQAPDPDPAQDPCIIKQNQKEKP